MKRFGQGPDLIDAFRENCLYSSRAGLLAKHIGGFGEPREHQAAEEKNELPFPPVSTATWCLFQVSPMLEKRVGSPLVLCKGMRRCLFVEGDSRRKEVAELWRRSGFQQRWLDNPW